MKPILYSYDINHILHWENILKQHGYVTVFEENELFNIANKLIIIAFEPTKDMAKLIKSIIKNNKLLILDAVPTLTKAKQMIALGARGYGNTLLSEIFMLSAIETIQNENIWFTPTLTKELIQSLELKSDDMSKCNDILNFLTTKEKQIALQLKEGDSNKEIAEKLDLSINTVKTHVRKIYSKLGVNDKLSFVMLFK